jgi:hypothetical protein
MTQISLRIVTEYGHLRDNIVTTAGNNGTSVP